MAETLVGRKALITGAGQGVGRGIALAIAAQGAAVALVGRTESKLIEVAKEIGELGGQALTISADVTRPEDIARSVTATVDGLGGLDILVNNAQQTALGSILDVEESALQACWESGTLAAFRLMRASYPYLRDGGVVINLGSSTSVNPMPVGRGVYASVKAATQTLSRVAAAEWGKDGIRVLTVLPASTSPAADAWAQAQPEEYARSLSNIPLGRLGDPRHDIGDVVAFLCSDAASYMTGTTIALDGGQAFLR